MDRTSPGLNSGSVRRLPGNIDQAWQIPRGPTIRRTSYSAHEIFNPLDSHNEFWLALLTPLTRLDPAAQTPAITSCANLRKVRSAWVPRAMQTGGSRTDGGSFGSSFSVPPEPPSGTPACWLPDKDGGPLKSAPGWNGAGQQGVRQQARIIFPVRALP
jgi:hypothetical protein